MMRVEPPVLIDPSSGCDDNSDGDVGDAIGGMPPSLIMPVTKTTLSFTVVARDRALKVSRLILCRLEELLHAALSRTKNNKQCATTNLFVALLCSSC